MQAHPHMPLAASAAALLALALLCLPAAAPGAGRMDTPSEEELIARGFRFVTEKPADKFHEIPGDDTVIRVYKKGQETVGLYILRNGRIYGYAVKVGGQPMAAYIDEYNSGYCAKDVSAGENFMIDLRAYGMDRASRRK
ncbi:hypothetical protein SAMN04488503_3273 [Humidesulfovibrio mexicanus]|jgi:hypothetical protein|uniref:Uncharacterized protein n=1 Tax=Humidesulfovibrio mexicanus TaxID=147047 RepID=A0A239CSX0_9BACT|nr:hypothetical protein [Humidesulfovibrio mexicanus]SNS23346.1 hypothetical protein SAMN04488503_3273 [Humidesulfovibrio mexicanus]